MSTPENIGLTLFLYISVIWVQINWKLETIFKLLREREAKASGKDGEE
jgi:hypothetical protein